jgi:tetratricopeptide (TPR) repeat protein
MTGTLRAPLFSLASVALLGFTFSSFALAQTAPSPAPTPQSAPTLKLRPEAQPPKPVDRAASYYHYGLAKMYENQAVANGRQDLATQAIEQYNLAMDADPNSPALQDGIANLYFRLGRIREAVSAAQDQVTKHPDDVEAHELLGRVYLRSLGDGQGPQANDMLQASIKEYEKIVVLKPNDLEIRLLLGQLYGLNHDSAKAEAQFKAAQHIDNTSEEVVLSMARLYSEQGDMQKAADVIVEVPASDRSSREDFALAGLYDTLKKPKEAAAAYQATLDQDPDNTDAKKGLAAALSASGQMDAAAKIYGQITAADPQDPQALIHQAEIQRQQGHYDESLATLKTAQSLVAENPELSFNEALDYDALGRYNDSIQTLRAILTATTAPDGKYADGERTNRSIFLDRLGIVCREAGRTDEAVEAYKQLAALGGDFQARGTDGEVQAYRDAHEWTKALNVAAEAAKAMPTYHEVQLTYASQLADSGKVDEGLKLANAQLNGTPDDRDVLFTVSDIQVRAKRWKDAALTLDKADALGAKPEQKVFVYYSRASLAESQKLYDQAEADLRKGLALEPDNAALQNYLGYLFADRGIHLDEAITLLKKAVAFDPQNGAYLDSLAWAYYKQGQYALAEDYAHKAQQRLGNDPAVLDHLGEIDAKNGKLQQSIDAWQKSLQSYSTSLAPEADPADVAKVQRKLETARVRLAHSGAAPASNAKP